MDDPATKEPKGAKPVLPPTQGPGKPPKGEKLLTVADQIAVFDKPRQWTFNQMARFRDAVLEADKDEAEAIMRRFKQKLPFDKVLAAEDEMSDK